MSECVARKSSRNGLRILFLSPNYREWACPAPFFEQEAILAALPDSRIYGPGYCYNTNYVPEIIREVFGDKEPDAIFCYVNGDRLIGNPMEQPTIEKYGLTGDMCVFPKGLNETNIPKIAWINDFWQYKSSVWEKILLSNDFSIAFSTYCPPFTEPDVFNHFFNRRTQEAVRFVPWPRSMSPQIFRDYGLPKIYDVTILGQLYKPFYPLRVRMHEVFLKQQEINYFSKAHPGYNYVAEGSALVGEQYARVINQSKIFASCTGKYRIPFMKLYEVIACNTALMCDAPCGAEYLGLENKHNYLAVTKKDFLKTATRYLFDSAELSRISHNARELFLERHTVDIRANEFKQIIAALLAGKEPGSWAEVFSIRKRRHHFPFWRA
jgi:hypothetical protein